MLHCCKMLCCLPTSCVVHTVNRFDLWISKQYRCLAFKTMYVQFCNEATSCEYWACKWDPIVRDRDETETRPRHLIFSPRRDRDQDLPTFPRAQDETETFGNYVSRPSRDRDYIPGLYTYFASQLNTTHSLSNIIVYPCKVASSVQIMCLQVMLKDANNAHGYTSS